mmetsp:Transcript_16140/g.29258  ORF Transcript_16140/g.29258 Transcript_16140/m.29258 type:complete len:455 (+) Transcript_16140:309-1673(+)
MQATDKVKGNSDIILTLGHVHLLHGLLEGCILLFALVLLFLFLVIGSSCILFLVRNNLGRHPRSLIFELGPQILLETADIHLLRDRGIGNINLLDLADLVEIVQIVVSIILASFRWLVPFAIRKGKSAIVVATKIAIVVVVKTEYIVFDVVESDCFFDGLFVVAIALAANDGVRAGEEPGELGDVNVGVGGQQEVLFGLRHLVGIFLCFLGPPGDFLLLKDGINVWIFHKINKNTILLDSLLPLLLLHSLSIIIKHDPLLLPLIILLHQCRLLLPMLRSCPKVPICRLFKLLHVKKGIITIPARRTALVECIAIAERIEKHLAIIVGARVDKGPDRGIATSVIETSIVTTEIDCKLPRPAETAIIRRELPLSAKVFDTKVSTSIIIIIAQIPHRQTKIRIKRHSQHTPPTPLHGNHVNTPLRLLLLLFRRIVQLQPLASRRGIPFVDSESLLLE